MWGWDGDFMPGECYNTSPLTLYIWLYDRICKLNNMKLASVLIEVLDLPRCRCCLKSFTASKATAVRLICAFLILSGGSAWLECSCNVAQHEPMNLMHFPNRD